MAIRYLKQPLRDITAVAASATTQITVPCDGRRVLGIILSHGYASGTNTVAAAHTNISQIRVVRNTKVIQKFSGTELRDLNLFNGTQFDSPAAPVPNTAPGVGIIIPFAEMWRDNDADKVAPGWRTDQIESMYLEVDLSSASTPTLAAACLFDYPLKVNTPQMIKRIERALIPASSTSFDWTVPFKKGFLQQISLYIDSGGSQTATKVTLRAGGVPVHEMTRPAQLASDQLNGSYPTATGRTATISDITLDADGLLERALDLSQAGEVTLTVEAGSAMSGNIVGLVQIVDIP